MLFIFYPGMKGIGKMKNTYESPLSSRYASDEMQYIFSPDKKFTTWHRLWIALAAAEKEGINDRAQLERATGELDEQIISARLPALSTGMASSSQI